MKRKYIILQVIEQPQIMEIWGALTEICRYHPEIDYNKVKYKKYPFNYKGLRFVKLEYKKLSIIQNAL